MKINKEYLSSVVKQHEADYMINQANNMLELVLSKQGPGNEFLGWLDLPINYDKEEFSRIVAASNRIRKESDVLVVVGIGGSYLGSKAVIDLFVNQFAKPECEVVFAGQNMSATYLNDLLDYLKDKDFSINVISKSGTTTEPAIAFRVLKEHLKAKYGEEYKSRIYATTDKSDGALRAQVQNEGYESFVIPQDIGGRFSVLTAVGLLPICVAGVNIDKLMYGAKIARDELCNKNSEAVVYAAYRNCLYNKGFDIEILVNYDPRLTMLSEWWKQLFGESEGKDQKGIFPASVTYSTDLHSMGQYVQDGKRNLFETVIKITQPNKCIMISRDEEDLDGLNYLNEMYLDEINNVALDATVMAHADGNVPNIIIELDNLSEEVIGHLIYFFELSCAISGYLLGVNPFDQPGVESYKKNMFALLNKPGFETLREKLLKK